MWTGVCQWGSQHSQFMSESPLSTAGVCWKQKFMTLKNFNFSFLTLEEKPEMKSSTRSEPDSICKGKGQFMCSSN